MPAFSFLFLNLIFPMTFSGEYDIIFIIVYDGIHLRKFVIHSYIITQGRTF